MARQNAARNEDDERVVNFDKKRRKNEESGPGGFLTTDERREAVGFVLLAIAVVLLTSLILNPSELRGIASSEHPSPAGKFGRWIATRIGIIFGFGGLVIPFSIGAWGAAIFQRKTAKQIVAKGLALSVALISACALLGLVYEGGYLGGALGDRLAYDLYQSFGVISFVVVIFAGIISLVIGTPLSFSEIGVAAWRGMGIIWARLMEMRAASAEASSERPVRTRNGETVQASVPAKKQKIPARDSEEAPIEGEDSGSNIGREHFDNAEMRIVTTPALKLIQSEPVKTKVPAKNSVSSSDFSPEISGESRDPLSRSGSPVPAPSSQASVQKAEPVYVPDADFTLPSLALLSDPPPNTASVTDEDLQLKAHRLQATLAEFGVVCKVGDIHPGPIVTRFELVPEPGCKVSSITSLTDDISLAMAARSIRIEAPIPGKPAVGIEIPNGQAQKVVIKQVLASDEFQRVRAQSPLAVALGQDISGNPVVTDLRRMPHLLIAGSTGSGKSVCINSLVNSILFSARPTEVKMLMVDPKVVELQEYNAIPHLLAPVVTDPRKAPRVLQWAVEEMDRRYQYLARMGVRDIDNFNRLVPEAPAQEDAAAADEFIDIDEEMTDQAVGVDGVLERMPYIVIIVDEFCDLMMIAAKECEDAIVRLASMARAVGIHLVIATQRPSVDVITGVIKANLPSRIAFLVSSKVDSRTILDVMGAERLLGQGDMLFKPGDRPKPMRLQGNYISGEEIKAVIKHYGSQGAARRQLQLEDTTSEPGSMNALANDDDPLLRDAMRICLEDGMASVSRIQRRLKIGHPRAARLVDIMEAKGLVTAPDGSKPRKLLYDEAYLGGDA